MEWSEPCVILSVSRHGEHHAIITVLSESRGRWRGLVRGGSGRRLAGVLQSGNEIFATWRARLEDQLGTIAVEQRRSRVGDLLSSPDRLAGLVSACATIEACLPEREAHPAVYQAFSAFLDLLCNEEMSLTDWGAALVRLELGVLSDLGFGLDLSRCAATGSPDDLVYVSPKSGRAVSSAAGRPYHDKLLPLPAFLLGKQAPSPNEEAIREGFSLTGYFLERHVTALRERSLPAERERLIARFRSNRD